MSQRLSALVILITLMTAAQDVAPQHPRLVMRRIIMGTDRLAQTEKDALVEDIHEYSDQCLLSSALIPQPDRTRLFLAIAISTDKAKSEKARSLMEQLVATKVNTILCDTVLDQLGLYSARRLRYDRVMGMMLAYSLPADVMEKAIEETDVDGFAVFITRLNDQDILKKIHEQGPETDPTAIPTNRSRLRNAIVKQIAREMLGFLQQGKNNMERLQDARRCLDELGRIRKTQQEQFPKDNTEEDRSWNAKPFMDAASYCLALADGLGDNAQEAANEAFFTMTDSLAELPQPWFNIVREYAIKYHRKQDYDFLMSNFN